MDHPCRRRSRCRRPAVKPTSRPPSRARCRARRTVRASLLSSTGSYGTSVVPSPLRTPTLLHAAAFLRATALLRAAAAPPQTAVRAGEREACAQARGATAMISAKRVEANRANAKKSTGPRTVRGKSRVSRNALRHGLRAMLSPDPAVSAEVTRMAKAICGKSTNAALYEAALRVAEYDLLIRRIRAARLAAI